MSAFQKPVRYTVTQLRSAVSCPRVFYFDAVHGRTRGKPVEVTRLWKSGAGDETTACGSLFHQTVERFNGAAATDVIVAETLAKAASIDELAQKIQRRVYFEYLKIDSLADKSGEQQQNFIGVLRGYVYELASFLWNGRLDHRPVEEILNDAFSERRRKVNVTFHVGSKGEGIEIAGILDYMFFDRRIGHRRILDYKLTPSTHISDDLVQVCTYALMHHQQHKTEPAVGVLYLHPDRHLVEKPWEDVWNERSKVYNLLASMREWEQFDEQTQQGVKPPGEPVWCSVCRWKNECVERLGPKHEGARLDYWKADTVDAKPQASTTTPQETHVSEPPVVVETELINSESQVESLDKPNNETTGISGTNSKWMAEVRDHMLRVLRQFNVTCREVKPPTIGPAFVRFFVFPERGITTKKVLTQAEQLHLHLALPAPPNMSVVDGTIGIDLPRPAEDRMSIPFSRVIPILPNIDELLGCAKIPVGMDLNGKWEWCNLASSESAHMLVVGTPGSGKSQWLRTAVASLMRTNTPETLGLLLIDPKMNAFQFVKGSRFLKQPIVMPAEDLDICELLNELIDEMEVRNKLLASSNSQSLSEHIQKIGSPLRRVICICDEYADLLDASETGERKAIEAKFKRIAQVGRAAGIHLILATQQPRANVITTAIRSLLPAKVALRVVDAKESQVALSEGGAERLLGNGDLLFKCIGGSTRLQGAWLPTEEESLVSVT